VPVGMAMLIGLGMGSNMGSKYWAVARLSRAREAYLGCMVVLLCEGGGSTVCVRLCRIAELESVECEAMVECRRGQGNSVSKRLQGTIAGSGDE